MTQLALNAELIFNCSALALAGIIRIINDAENLLL